MNIRRKLARFLRLMALKIDNGPIEQIECPVEGDYVVTFCLRGVDPDKPIDGWTRIMDQDDMTVYGKTIE